MRGYGLPRNDDVANPDKGDQRRFGLNSFRFRRPKVKASSRRIWAKAARNAALATIRAEIAALSA